VDLGGIVSPGPQGAVVVIVPRHQRIAVGTLRSIVRQAGVAVEVFPRLPD